MKADKLIIEEMNNVAYKNLPKMVVSLLLMVVINGVIGSLITTALSLFGNVAVCMGLLWLVVYSSLFLYDGFSSILGNLYTKKPTYLGDLFCGRKDNRRLINISAIVLIVLFVVVLASTIFLFVMGKNIADSNSEEFLLEMQNKSLIFAMSALLIIFLGMILYGIPRAMLFPSMYNNPKMKFKEVLSYSRELLEGKVFKFIWFCIKACKIPLITSIVSMSLTFFVSNYFIYSIAETVFIISFYYTIIYIILSINAYYYELTAKKEEFLGIENGAGKTENLNNLEKSSEEEECLSLTEE